VLIFRYSARELLRHPARSLLAVLGVAVACAMLLDMLMLGGGLILRAGTAEPNVADPIAWGFDAADRPLTNRVVFTLSGTPQSFRINGLLIRGENTSDRPLNAVEGVISSFSTPAYRRRKPSPRVSPTLKSPRRFPATRSRRRRRSISSLPFRETVSAPKSFSTTMAA